MPGPPLERWLSWLLLLTLLLLVLPPIPVRAWSAIPPSFQSRASLTRSGGPGLFNQRIYPPSSVWPRCLVRREAERSRGEVITTSPASTNKTATTSSMTSSPGQGPGLVERIMSASTRQAVEDFIKSPRTEIGLALIVFTSCVLFSLQTLDGTSGSVPGGIDLGVPVLSAIEAVQQAIGVVFLLEYFARWYYQGFDLRYLLTPYMLIDGAVVLPTVLRLINAPMLPGGISLEFLRLLRVLRLQRFFSNPKSFVRTFGKFWAGAGSVKVWQLEIANIVGEIITLLFVSSGLMYEAEKAVNPQFSDFFAALYFGLTTLTTVGFGDIVPITPAGRAIVGLSIVFGVTIFPVQLSALANSLIKDTKLEEGLISSATVAATTAIPPPPPPSPTTLSSSTGTTTTIQVVELSGDFGSAVEDSLDSVAFAALAAEEGVDLATARRLVRAAVLGVAPDSIEEEEEVEGSCSSLDRREEEEEEVDSIHR